MPNHASSSLDLVVTASCGLTLQICLIIALSFRCRCWRFCFVNGQVSLAWNSVLRTQEQYIRPRVLKERWLEERTGSSSLNYFQAVFTHAVVESSQPPALIVLGFNDMSTLEGHFVSSPREREKRDRRESRGDEREG